MSLKPKGSAAVLVENWNNDRKATTREKSFGNFYLMKDMVQTVAVLLEKKRSFVRLDPKVLAHVPAMDEGKRSDFRQIKQLRHPAFKSLVIDFLVQ